MKKFRNGYYEGFYRKGEVILLKQDTEQFFVGLAYTWQGKAQIHDDVHILTDYDIEVINDWCDDLGIERLFY